MTITELGERIPDMVVVRFKIEDEEISGLTKRCELLYACLVEVVPDRKVSIGINLGAVSVDVCVPSDYAGAALRAWKLVEEYAE